VYEIKDEALILMPSKIVFIPVIIILPSGSLILKNKYGI
jgi:hypothetical protein